MHHEPHHAINYYKAAKLEEQRMKIKLSFVVVVHYNHKFIIIKFGKAALCVI
jgi:hypothetical protein